MKKGNVIKPIAESARNVPETLSQARYFDMLKRHYEGLDLCGACAAQAAHGHQIGFSLSRPPCPACEPIVNTFPTQRTNGWWSLSPRRGAKFSPGLRPE